MFLRLYNQTPSHTLHFPTHDFYLHVVQALSVTQYLFFSLRDRSPWFMFSAVNMACTKERGQKLGDRGRTHKNTPPTNPAHHLSGHCPNSPVLANRGRYLGENLLPFVSGIATTQRTLILTLVTFSVDRSARSWLFSSKARTSVCAALSSGRKRSQTEL